MVMVCFIVVWESLVGVGGDLMFIHRIYHIIPHLVFLMHARHRMKELLRGSGIWSKFLQTYSLHMCAFLYVVCCMKALLGVICFKVVMVFKKSVIAVLFLLPSTSTRLSTSSSCVFLQGRFTFHFQLDFLIHILQDITLRLAPYITVKFTC